MRSIQLSAQQQQQQSATIINAFLLTYYCLTLPRVLQSSVLGPLLLLALAVTVLQSHRLVTASALSKPIAVTGMDMLYCK